MLERFKVCFEPEGASGGGGGSEVPQNPETNDDRGAGEHHGRGYCQGSLPSPRAPPPGHQQHRRYRQGEGEQGVHPPRAGEVEMGEVVYGAQTPAGGAQIPGQGENWANPVTAGVGAAQRKQHRPRRHERDRDARGLEVAFYRLGA